MAKYVCSICGYEYDESEKGVSWENLPEDWLCPICGFAKSYFARQEEKKAAAEPAAKPETGDLDYLKNYAHADADEPAQTDIQAMALSGRPIIEAMRTKTAVKNYWDEVLIKGAQLAKLPLNRETPVSLKTVIGPRAAQPLAIDLPVFISHMSFGALSREAQIALAQGSAAVKTAMCSGEGGILPETLAASYKFIFEYVPNEYSLTDDNLRAAAAIEIKFGQAAKPGLGGHLPAEKVTAEIAAVRNKPVGQDIISPARFRDIGNADNLKKKISWLRERSGGKPIGVKLAAGHIEADLAVALAAEPDFITIDGRPGGTGASPKTIKSAVALPTLFALSRARRYLDQQGIKDVSLIITGGLRTAADFAKALALGADAVAIATAALMAIGCQQYRICHTGRCPLGIATQDPALRARFNIDKSAQRLANYLAACSEELSEFTRLTGNDDIHNLNIHDLATIDSEIAQYTGIEHV